MRWERTFELSAPPGRVWEAFSSEEGDVPKVFRRDNAYLSRGAITIDIHREEPGVALEWTEVEGEHRWDMTVTFTETTTGTSVTIVRSGFGDSAEWLGHGAGRWVGWQCVMADLEVFYRTGKMLGRFYGSKWDGVGVRGYEAGGGVTVLRVFPDSFAAAAGIEPGDVIVSLGGVPVYGLNELWLLPMTIEGETEIGFVRGSEIQSSRAVLGAA